MFRSTEGKDVPVQAIKAYGGQKWL